MINAYTMQDLRRKISPIELELERVRKFSIIDCIRDEVRDVISKLPKKSEAHFQQKIDEVIRRNLLKERKVRFGNAGDKRDEPEKDALEEIEVILQVLGNDKNNKLVIENFDLLEKRIKSVEQRLSGLIRKVPDLENTKRPAVKIDPERVKTNMQDFVNMFNHVFTSTYEVLTNTNSSLLDETMSSKNRLKFHLLAHLTELKEFESDEQFGTKKFPQASFNNSTKLGKGGKYASKDYLDKSDSKIEVPVIKAVDSLITLRQRFKAQSAKWKQLKCNKKTSEPEDKAKKPQQGKPSDLNLKKREDLKSKKKNKEKDLSEQNLHTPSVDDSHYYHVTEEPFDLSHMEKAINDSLRKNAKDNKEIEKKNENRTKRKPLPNGPQKIKDLSQELGIPNTNELLRTYVNKTILRKSTPPSNPKERLTKIPPRYTITNSKIETQNEFRKGKLSKITNKYIPMETLYEKFPSRLGTGLKIDNQNVLIKEKIPPSKSRYSIAFKVDSFDERPEENVTNRSSTVTNTFEVMQEELPKPPIPTTEMTDSSDTIIPLYTRESLVNESGNSTTVFDSEELLSKPEQYKKKLMKKLETRNVERNTSETTLLPDTQDKTQNEIDVKKTCTTVNNLLLKENEILNSLIADIADELAKTNREGDHVGPSVEETKEDLPKESQAINREESLKDITIIKEVSLKECKATTEKEKSPKNSKVSNTLNSADTKEKLPKHSQRRNTVTVLQAKDRQSKDAKKADKSKAKDSPPKSKDTNVPKSIKIKLNTFKKEQQPGLMKIPEKLPSLYKQTQDYRSFFPSMLKETDSKTSGSSIEMTFKKSSNLSTDTYSKTSLSLLSELKLHRNRMTRYKSTPQKM